MNLPETGKNPLGKPRNAYSALVTYRQTEAHALHVAGPGTLQSTDPRRQEQRPLISNLHYEQRQTMYRSSTPNNSRRQNYKTRLYDHKNFGPVLATPRKHSTPGPTNTAEVQKSSEQADDHSTNTRPSYKALSIRRQQKKQQQKKLLLKIHPYLTNNHGKGKVRPRTGHEDPEGEQTYSSTLPSTSALDGGGWSRPRPGRFNPGKDPVPIV